MVSAFKSIVNLKFRNSIPLRINSLKTIRIIHRIRQPRISVPVIFAMRRSKLETQKSPMHKQNFYAVQRGRSTGVYLTWGECEEQVKQFPGAVFKKFRTAEEAEAFVKEIPSTTAMTQPLGRKRTLSNAVDEKQCIVVYSDGACKGNGQVGSVAGVGVFYGPNDPRNLAERCPGDQTNNRAELIAIVRVLETAPVTNRKILIKTDSKYSIDCLEKWLPQWMKNGFRTKEDEPVKNVGILKYLVALLDARANRGQPVLFRHVRGHSGNPGNDGADAQANVGTTFPPRPELDWEALEASVHKTIDGLVQTMDGQIATASEGVASAESPTERPNKILKHSHESTEPAVQASSSLKPDPKTDTQAFAPPFIPPPAHSHRHSADKQPTGQAPIDQAIPNVLFASTPCQPTNSSTVNREGLAASSSHNQVLKLDEAAELSGSLKFQLKASRVSAPLIPVSPNDIDPNIYQDCLLEGEEWAKEIQDL